MPAMAGDEAARQARTQDRYPEFLEDQREFFDTLITADWETYLDPEWDAVRRREVEAIMSRVAGPRVLDAGCGCGFHDAEIANWPGVEEVVGIDYSAKSIETAEREYPHPRVRRRVADILEPLGEAPFDLVVSFQVVEHLTEPREFLQALAANAAPGGAVAVVTPNGRRLDNRLRRLRGKAPEAIDPQHYAEYSPCELVGLAAGLPLEPLATVGLSASFLLPRLGRQVLPQRFGRMLAARVPAISSSYAQIWRRAPAA